MVYHYFTDSNLGKSGQYSTLRQCAKYHTTLDSMVGLGQRNYIRL